MSARARERDGHLTLSIGLVSVDSRVLNRSPRPAIRYRQDDRSIDNCVVRPREFQKMRRYSLGLSGVREEDLVVLLYFLLASAYGKGHEVEAYSPVIGVRHILVVDGRDEEIIILLVESSERFD